MKHPLFSLLLISVSLTAMTDDLWQSIIDHTIDGEREIVVIVPTYNNARGDTCIRNIQSILWQEYDNYHVYIINDCSTDKTYQKIAKYVAGHPCCDKVTLINNEQRKGGMANFYHAIHALPDHVIVINVDGDDELAHEFVFARINEEYQDPRVWITYGQFVEHPHNRIGFCRGYPAEVIKENRIRRHAMHVSHLRTYYAWLFKKIRKEDLMYNGTFFQATYDKAIMMPMIEMSGGRFKCIEEVLYIYNFNNPLSLMRVSGVIQGSMRDYLKKQRPYEPLMPVITDFAIERKKKR